MKILQPHAVRNYLSKINVSEVDRKLALSIIDRLDGAVATIQEEILYHVNPASANKRFNRLPTSINACATDVGLSFKACVTSTRSMGPKAQFICFEADSLPAPKASTSELDAIEPGQLPDTGAVETGPTELPERDGRHLGRH